MTKEEIVKNIIDAPSACRELKEAAQNYLDEVGTSNEFDCAEKLIAEAKDDLMKNEDVLGFFCSAKAEKLMGKDECERLRVHHQELIDKGIIYCDCPGCTAAKLLIDNEDLFKS